MKTRNGMTNGVSFQILAAITLGIAILLTGCGGQSTNPADDVLPEDSPEIMVEEFYQWYSLYLGNALMDKAYRDCHYFSQDYIRELDKLVEKGGLRADPIVCAQDMANSFTASGSEINGNTAIVRILSGFGNQIDVEVKPFDGAWKITRIACIH